MKFFDIPAARLTPYQHQLIGVSRILEHPYFFLADEMGAGKTKQAIDAALILFSKGLINRVIVVTPASVRSVWFDPEIGELAKHLWVDVPCLVTEYHSKNRQWGTSSGHPLLRWVITNYDFIRDAERLDVLLKLSNAKTLLILDESSAVKNHRAKQTKSCLKLRQACGRVLLMNGTPIANHPGDLFSQCQIMHPSILGCKTYFHFRARYAIMGGWQGRVITGWQNIEDLQQRIAPYIIQRRTRDCIDLPPEIPPVTHTVQLTEGTWKIYKQMRDEMVAWLSATEVATAQQSIVKALRLAQITSGFLGGVETDVDAEETEQRPDWIEELEQPIFNTVLGPVTVSGVSEVGREKLDFFRFTLLPTLFETDKNLKLLVWCRFIPELERLMREFQSDPMATYGKIRGIRKHADRAERDRALRLLHPDTTPEGPVIVAGTYGTGSMGHNFTASHTVVNLSSDYSLWKDQQSRARVNRPGQTHPVLYIDVVAEGPKGQKTIDHTIIKARRTKEDVAKWTTSAWIKALTEE